MKCIMLEERARSILEASIREFIKTGEPITSARLYQNYDFGIKPAMIRWELHKLAGQKFFHQAHPSGGRMPSDRAYHVFVEEMVQQGRAPKRLRLLVEALFEGEYREFIKNMAKTLGVLGVCASPEEDASLASGLEDLLASIGKDRNMLVQIARDVEMLPERVQAERAWWEGEQTWPQVFIGESPFTRAENLSVIIGKIKNKHKTVLIMALGQKRMDYEKSLRLFRHMQEHMHV